MYIMNIMNIINTESYNNNFLKRFTFNKKLGSGSFSTVYSVYDKLNSRKVALKINKNNKCFKNEISILSKLRSKEKNNIILFGATPACVELAYKFPTNKLVLFNKGILADYSFAELDENFNPKND